MEKEPHEHDIAWPECQHRHLLAVVGSGPAGGASGQDLLRIGSDLAGVPYGQDRRRQIRFARGSKPEPADQRFIWHAHRRFAGGTDARGSSGQTRGTYGHAHSRFAGGMAKVNLLKLIGVIAHCLGSKLGHL